MQIKKYIILFWLLLGGTTFAADVYITQNGAGEEDGTNCANAYSAAWFDSNATGGNTYNLCGTFTGGAGATMLNPPSGSDGNILTVEFEEDAVLTAPYWGTNGAIYLNGKSYVTIDGGTNGVIKNTTNGTSKANQQASNGIRIYASDHITVQDLTIDDIYQNEGGQASTDSAGKETNNILLSGSMNNITITGCTLIASRTGIRYDMDADTLDTITFSDNTISDHAWGIMMGSGSTSTDTTDIVISGNEITGWLNWQCPADAAYCTNKTDTYHTDGIILYQPSTNEDAFEPRIFNNYIHGDLGHGSPTAFIYATHGGAGGTLGSSAIIYNNLLIYEDGGVGSNNHWAISTGSLTSNHIIYSNTMIGISSSYGSAMMLSGTGMTIKNNIITDSKYAIASYSTTFASDGNTIDNNFYYDINAGEAGYMFHQNESYPQAPADYWTFAQWQTAGFDASGDYVDPLFVGEGDYNLQAESTLISAGADLGASYNTDYIGTSRPQGIAWDIGAYEFIPEGEASGTIIPGGCQESDIVDGGKTIVITLSGDEWVAEGETFDAQRQNIIDDMDSAQSEAAGWDAVVKVELPVTAVVRTNATTVTITLPDFDGDPLTAYEITANEIITATVPGTAVVGGKAIVCGNTFQISAEQAGAEVMSIGFSADGPTGTFADPGIAITN